MKAFCTRCGFSGEPRPSSVTMRWPGATEESGVTQDRTAWPLTFKRTELGIALLHGFVWFGLKHGTGGGGVQDGRPPRLPVPSSLLRRLLLGGGHHAARRVRSQLITPPA